MGAWTRDLFNKLDLIFICASTVNLSRKITFLKFICMLVSDWQVTFLLKLFCYKYAVNTPLVIDRLACSLVLCYLLKTLCTPEIYLLARGNSICVDFILPAVTNAISRQLKYIF